MVVKEDPTVAREDLMAAIEKVAIERVATEKVAMAVEAATDHPEVNIEVRDNKTPTIDHQEEKVATVVAIETDTETDQEVPDKVVVTTKVAKEEEAVSAVDKEVVAAANTVEEAVKDNNNTEKFD